MSQADMKLPQMRPLGGTSRKDAWWLQSTLTALGLLAFIVYATWAAMQGVHYFVSGVEGDSLHRHYLSPVYSPVLFDSAQLKAQGISSGHAWFGAWPDWLPAMLLGVFPLTPAFLILWAPGGFRVTCYYYRGAYYKAFWADPPGCAVGEPGFRGKRYRGEKKFPLIFQNVHRYFLYLAIIFIGLLTYDALLSYWFTDPVTHKGRVGLAVGSIVLTINPILLGGYTFGCHSLRHLIGGRKNSMGAGAQRKAYDCVSCLNKSHMRFAWASLFWVGFTDLYVRMVSMGVWTDWRIF